MSENLRRKLARHREERQLDDFTGRLASKHHNQRISRMMVEMREEARPGTRVLVKSSERFWHGIWRGDQPIPLDSTCDVEISADDIQEWQACATDENDLPGI